MAAKRTYTKRAAGGDGPVFTRRRAAAALAAVLGYLATVGFVDIFLNDWRAVWGIAAVIEWLVWEGKNIVLSGERRRDPLGVAAIIGDSIMNGGGMFAFVLQLDGTEQYKMLSAGLGGPAEMRNIPAVVIALVLGFVLAVAPHILWREREGE